MRVRNTQICDESPFAGGDVIRFAIVKEFNGRKDELRLDRVIYIFKSFLKKIPCVRDIAMNCHLDSNHKKPESKGVRFGNTVRANLAAYPNIRRVNCRLLYRQDANTSSAFSVAQYR